MQASRHPKRCWSIWRSWNASTTSADPIRPTRPSWSASVPADIGARRCTAPSPRRTFWRSRRPFVTIGKVRAPTARCTWARTRTPCPRRPSAPRWKCWRPTECETIIQQDDGVTPTPVISRAILVYNRDRQEHLADGIVITPSHNPPEDGGFKYNPTNGGPADVDVTGLGPADGPTSLLRSGNAGVKRMPFESALKADTTHEEDFVMPYVEDLKNIVDMDAHPRGGPASWVSIRWAAPRSPIGSRSTPSMAWTLPSSTRPSTRRSRS